MSQTGKGKILPVLLAVCCIALAVILAAGAVMVWLDGSARRAENPLESVYTAENAGRVLTAALPVFGVFLCLLVICLITGTRPEEKKPAAGRMTPRAELKHRNGIRAAVFVAAALLIIAGIANGSVLDVLAKAVSICTECVGLG